MSTSHLSRYCNSNHVLVRELPPAFTCDCCGTLFPRGCISWRCNDCNFDCCDRCHSAPTCRGRHILRSAVVLDTPFQCDQCKKSHPAGTIAFSCRKRCNYDIGPCCIPPIPPSATTAATGASKQQQQQQQQHPGFKANAANVPEVAAPLSATTTTTTTNPASSPTISITTQLSPARGSKCRALFVGVNYFQTPAQLRDSTNSLFAMMKLLRALGFDLSSSGYTRVLCDDRSFAARTGTPDRKSIEAELARLGDGAMPGDTIFVYFVGHTLPATSLAADDDAVDRSGVTAAAAAEASENRMMMMRQLTQTDDCFVPADWQRAGLLRLDLVMRGVFKQLPAGVRVTCIIDGAYGNANSPLECEYEYERDHSVTAAIGTSTSPRSATTTTTASMMQQQHLLFTESARQQARGMSTALKHKLEMSADVMILSAGRLAANSSSAQFGAGIERAADINQYALSQQQQQQQAAMLMKKSDSTSSSAVVPTTGGCLTAAFAEAIAAKVAVDGKPRVSLLELLQRVEDGMRRRGYGGALSPIVASSKKLNMQSGFSLFGELPK